MLWRPTSFRPHVLTLTCDQRWNLLDTTSGKPQHLFISFKHNLPADLQLLCDIAEPRDLGLQYLVIYGLLEKGIPRYLDQTLWDDIMHILRMHVDERHPMTPYRIFVIEPDMLSEDPQALLDDLLDSNIHFVGVSLVVQ